MANLVTESGLEKLKKELENTKLKLKEVADRIKEAKDLGDLSENSEYLEAKNEQSFLLGRAGELEQKIKNAQIAQKCVGVVSVGCKVEVENEKQKMHFYIVGSEESDPLNGRISVVSPIGSALYGKKSGESVSVKTPRGVSEYRIVKIN